MFADALLFSTAVESFCSHEHREVVQHIAQKQWEMSSIRLFLFSGVTLLQVIYLYLVMLICSGSCLVYHAFYLVLFGMEIFLPSNNVYLN